MKLERCYLVLTAPNRPYVTLSTLVSLSPRYALNEALDLAPHLASGTKVRIVISDWDGRLDTEELSSGGWVFTVGGPEVTCT